MLKLLCLVGSFASASANTIVVSVPEQRLYVFDETGQKIASYAVSTSANGLGDGRGTYSTPLGKMEIAGKIGGGAQIGAVFKAGRQTGEICKINSPGRDPIVTRILHLRGLEKQNSAAFARRIYIHGTPDERHIGKPVSYGCIRMRSRDVIELYDLVKVGTPVEVVNQRVSKGLFGKTVWNVPPTPASSGKAPNESPAATISTAKVKTSEPHKIAITTRATSSPEARTDKTTDKTTDKEDGRMTVFEMPGMSFKFGPASRDEVR